MLKGLAFIYLCWLSACLVRAQSFTIYNYSVAEGLPSPEVYHVFQDSHKFIWFATDNGIVRFDGLEMKTFHMKDSLQDPVVFGFYEDKKGRVWFRTFSGKLSYYENGQIKPYKGNKYLEAFTRDDIIFKMLVEDDDLWFATRRVIGKISIEGHLTKEQIRQGSFLYKSVGEGIWGAAAPVNTITVDGRSFELELPETMYSNSIHCSMRWKDKLYFTVNRDILEYDGTSIKRVYTGCGPIISLSKDQHDNLWAGYKNCGAEKFSRDDFINSWQPAFLNEKSVTNVIQDHEGGLWFSTLEKGVYYVPNLYVDHIPLPKASTPTEVVSAPGYVFVGDQLGTLYAYDIDTKEVCWKRYHGLRITALFYNNNNHLWVSNGLQAHIYDESLKIIKTFPYNLINFCSGPDNTVWATGYVTCAKFNAHGGEVSFKSTEHLYRTILADDSLIFLAPRTGLHVADKALQTFSVLPEFSNYKIPEITQLNDSILFIATIGSGFLLLNTNTWKHTPFNSNNQFIADNIYDVLKTDSVLWTGTENGLIRIPLTSLIHKNLTFHHIGERSGLKSNRINFLASTAHSLWAFSDDGITSVPYDNIQFSGKHPVFYFRNITVNSHLHHIAHEIKLPFNKNNISIAFGYISFNNQGIFTRHRLSRSEPWIYTRNRELHFAALAPGNYNVELEYSTDNVHWTSCRAPLAITISPPWWKLWFVQVSGFLIILFLIYTYYCTRLQVYKQKHQYLKVVNQYQQKLIQSEIDTLERERSRIAKELHDGVSSNLTAIKLMVSHSFSDEKKTNGVNIEEQLQHAIKEIKDIIYALAPAGLERYGLTASMKNYVEKLNKNIPVKIELHAFGEEVYDSQLGVPLFRIIQELISNSLKHAQAANILIHVNVFEDLLSIQYEDDGRGFSEVPMQKGLGLDNIHARIQSLNGNITFDSGTFGTSYCIDVPFNLKKPVP